MATTVTDDYEKVARADARIASLRLTKKQALKRIRKREKKASAQAKAKAHRAIACIVQSVIASVEASHPSHDFGQAWENLAVEKKAEALASALTLHARPTPDADDAPERASTEDETSGMTAEDLLAFMKSLIEEAK